MVTTRRLSNSANNSFEQFATANSDVAVLDRPIAEEKVEEVQAVKSTINNDLTEEAKERRKNLDRILNYDRYSEQMTSVVDTLAPAIEEEKFEMPSATVAITEEDIRPTSTTMQFGEDIEGIREEMKAEREEEKVNYRLNGKGKLAIILYSLAITVILALIVMNTGMLSRLDKAIAEKRELHSATLSEYSMVKEEIDAISNSAYIADVAENVLGMSNGN